MDGYEIDINVMEPYNPREEGDNLGQIVTPTPYKYSWVGDYSVSARDLLNLVGMYVRNNIPFLPVYVLDHSGIRVSTKTFNDPWDESHVGYILGDQRAYLKEIGGKRMSAKRRADLRKRLASEISDFDDYLNTTYYEYTLYDPNGDDITSDSWFESEDDARVAAESFLERWKQCD